MNAYHELLQDLIGGTCLIINEGSVIKGNYCHSWGKKCVLSHGKDTRWLMATADEMEGSQAKETSRAVYRSRSWLLPGCMIQTQ